MAASALKSRDFIPILSHICFLPDRLFAYDDITAVVVKHRQDEIRGAVRGKMLLDVVNSSLSPEIEITQEEGGNEITIKDGRSKVKLPCLPESDFVFKTPKVPEDTFYNLGEGFIEALSFVSSLCSADSAKLVTTGVTIVATGKGTELLATDNRTCVRRQLKAKCKGEQHAPIILSQSAIAIICRTWELMSEDTDKVTAMMCIGDGVVRVEMVGADDEEVTIYAKTIADTPLDFETIIKTSTKGVTPIPVHEDLEQALARCSTILTDEVDKIMRIAPGKKGVLIQAKSELGEFSGSIPGDPSSIVEVNVDPLLVQRVLHRCKRMGTSDRALIMEGDDFLYLISSIKRAPSPESN